MLSAPLEELSCSFHKQKEKLFEKAMICLENIHLKCLAIIDTLIRSWQEHNIIVSHVCLPREESHWFGGKIK